jgi:hypothetical protein
MFALKEPFKEEEEHTEPMVESHHISLPTAMSNSMLLKSPEMSPELISNKLD